MIVGKVTPTKQITAMKILFIIPARSGSVRLKHKNIRPFLGKDLFLHTIKFVQSSLNQLTEHSCKVCISTNDKHILRYSEFYPHIDFFPRDESLSSSIACLEDVCDVLLSMYFKRDLSFDLVCLLQVTSQLRDNKLITRGLNCLLSCSNSNGVIELEEQKHHLGNVIDNIWIPYNKSDIQSQKLDSLYKPSGRLFMYRVDNNDLICRDNLSAMIINPQHVNNIDTLEDFVLAELKAKQISEFDYLFD